MCTWKHFHLWALNARNNNMVALFTELSKTFKRKRFGKRPRWDLSFLFFYNVDFFYLYLTLVCRVWFRHQNMYRAFCQQRYSNYIIHLFNTFTDKKTYFVLKGMINKHSISLVRMWMNGEMLALWKYSILMLLVLY